MRITRYVIPHPRSWRNLNWLTWSLLLPRFSNRRDNCWISSSFYPTMCDRISSRMNRNCSRTLKSPVNREGKYLSIVSANDKYLITRKNSWFAWRKWRAPGKKIGKEERKKKGWTRKWRLSISHPSLIIHVHYPVFDSSFVPPFPSLSSSLETNSWHTGRITSNVISSESIN